MMTIKSCGLWWRPRYAMRSPVRVPRPSGGFTFVEVLVAVVVLSLGLLALTSFATVTGREYSRSKQRLLSSNLAREQIDSLRTVPYRDLALGARNYEVTVGSAAFSVTRVVQEPRPYLKLVVVSVVGPDNKEHQRFSTYVYDEDPTKNAQKQKKKK